MATDFRLAVNVLDHPKLLKLRARLGAEAVLGWIRLLGFAAQYRPDGNLTEMSPEDIALAAGWNASACGNATSIAQSNAQLESSNAKLESSRCPSPFLSSPILPFLDLASTLVEIKLFNFDGDTYSLHDWQEHQPWLMGERTRQEKARKAAQAKWSKTKKKPPIQRTQVKAQAETLVAIWNNTVLRLPKVKSITPQLISHCSARLQGHKETEIEKAFRLLDQSDIAQPWGSLHWIVKSEDNLTKTLEGNYDNSRGQMRLSTVPPRRKESEPRTFKEVIKQQEDRS